MRGWRGAELDQLNPYRDGFAVVLISTPALAGAATQAVQQAGGRVMRSIDWPAFAEEIGRQAGRPLLLIDTHGAPATAMEVALARIDAVATALDLPIAQTARKVDIACNVTLCAAVNARTAWQPQTAAWRSLRVMRTKLLFSNLSRCDTGPHRLY